MSNLDKKDCLKYGFLGPETCGKTFAGLHASRLEKTIIRLNPTHEDAMSEGALVVTTKASLVQAIQLADGKRKSVICWNFPARLDGYAALDWACRVAVACPHRCAIFMNEGETLFPKNSALTTAVNQVLRQGKQHVHVPLYWTAQRPRDVNLQLRNNTNRWHFFRNDDETYCDFVKSKAGREMSEKVQALENYEFIFKDSTGAPAITCKNIKKLKS